MCSPSIRSVAVIGAGSSGAIVAAALAAEECFDIVRVFERRESPGGQWIYDQDPGATLRLEPGKLPPEIDPPIIMPPNLPEKSAPNTRERFAQTAIYDDLTTNIPDIAMCYSDVRFPYGPFVPHWIPRQYIANYFSQHGTEKCLVLNTTVEDVSRIPGHCVGALNRWRLTLRKNDPIGNVDNWWQEEFDAVILANGHFSVPYVPYVKGLQEYMDVYPGRVTHAKTFRNTEVYMGKTVLVIGNSDSGQDITTILLQCGKPKAPLYNSRRSKSEWDGEKPPNGLVWKPIIREFDWRRDVIIFEDETQLANVDAVIYCTGYKPSFPFWNARMNGGPLYDYEANRLFCSYQHTFFRHYPHNLGIVGFPRTLAFRAFEYQAVALARLFSGRNARSLPSLEMQEQWEIQRAELVAKEHRFFHETGWENGENEEWFQFLYDFSGLPRFAGQGRCPPVFKPEIKWAVDHIPKYPIPDKTTTETDIESDWVMVSSLNA